MPTAKAPAMPAPSPYSVARIQWSRLLVGDGVAGLAADDDPRTTVLISTAHPAEVMVTKRGPRIPPPLLSLVGEYAATENAISGNRGLEGHRPARGSASPMRADRQAPTATLHHSMCGARATISPTATDSTRVTPAAPNPRSRGPGAATRPWIAVNAPRTAHGPRCPRPSAYSTATGTDIAPRTRAAARTLPGSGAGREASRIETPSQGNRWCDGDGRVGIVAGELSRQDTAATDRCPGPCESRPRGLKQA